MVDLNEEPVIGILSQPLEESMKTNPLMKNYSSYILASYVDYVKAQGARIVPIINGDS